MCLCFVYDLFINNSCKKFIILMWKELLVGGHPDQSKFYICFITSPSRNLLRWNIWLYKQPITSLAILLVIHTTYKHFELFYFLHSAPLRWSFWFVTLQSLNVIHDLTFWAKNLDFFILKCTIKSCFGIVQHTKLKIQIQINIPKNLF